MRLLAAALMLVVACACPVQARTPQQERQLLHSQALQLKAMAWGQWWEVGRLIRELGGLAQAMVRTRVRLEALAARARALGAQIQELAGEQKELEARVSQAREWAARRLRTLYLHGLKLPQIILARAGAEELLGVGYSLRLVLEADRKRLEALGRQVGRLGRLREELRVRSVELSQAITSLCAEFRELQSMALRRQELLQETGSRIAKLVESVTALARAEGRLVRTFGLGPAAGLGMAAAVVPGATVVGRTGKGVVVAAVEGEAVMSPWDGVVSFAGDVPGWAKVVVVDHEGRVHTVVGGLKSLEVRAGQQVRAGQVLGIVGASQRVYLELRMGTRVLKVQRWLGLGG